MKPVAMRYLSLSVYEQKLMHSCRNITEKSCKKLKGIKKNIVKKRIHFEHYKDCLFSGRDHYAQMVTFRSKLHQASTIEQVKKSLSRFDDKRYILDDGMYLDKGTVHHGHHHHCPYHCHRHRHRHRHHHPITITPSLSPSPGSRRHHTLRC